MEETEGVDRLLSTPERETGPAGQNHLHPHLLTAAGQGDRGGAGGTVGEEDTPRHRTTEIKPALTFVNAVKK